jgi:hypothetical protein
MPANFLLLYCAAQHGTPGTHGALDMGECCMRRVRRTPAPTTCSASRSKSRLIGPELG